MLFTYFTRPSATIIARLLALVRPRLVLSPLIVHTYVPFFHISYYSFDIILVSASSSYFTLVVPVREVRGILCGIPVPCSLC